ncbi:hypothetical protein DMENIID0001_146250 [Sergentomyia squamirostris]
MASHLQSSLCLNEKEHIVLLALCSELLAMWCRAHLKNRPQHDEEVTGKFVELHNKTLTGLSLIPRSETIIVKRETHMEVQRFQPDISSTVSPHLAFR